MRLQYTGCRSCCGSVESPSRDMGKRWSWRSPVGAGQPSLPIRSKTKCMFGPGDLCVEQRLKAQSVSFHLLLDNCCDAVT